VTQDYSELLQALEREDVSLVCIRASIAIRALVAERDALRRELKDALADSATYRDLKQVQDHQRIFGDPRESCVVPVARAALGETE
jgi:hypothetical protein